MNNDTSCKLCIFAEYEGFTQVGCKKGRIKKYKDSASTVIEAYDEDKEFYVIKDRTCMFRRTQVWLDRLGEDPHESTIDVHLRLESQPSVHIIILLKDKTLEDLEKTVRSLSGLEILPVKITVVVSPKNRINPSDIKEIFDKDSIVPWRIQGLVFDLSDKKAIHMTQKTCKSQYYGVIDAGSEVDSDVLNVINDVVIDHLLQFAMIEDKNIYFIPLGVHEYFYFHADPDKTIPENLKDHQCQNPDHKVVFNMQEVRSIQRS